MAAFSDTYPWPSHNGGFSFFEHRMRTHSRVASLVPMDTGLYLLATDTGKSLVVFICDCYSYGVAEYIETISKIGNVDVVIINSVWCGYTDDVKLQCREERVGIFNIKDFMGALNRPDYWLYLNEYDRERFKERGLI